jgi:hypothetical protein
MSYACRNVLAIVHPKVPFGIQAVSNQRSAKALLISQLVPPRRDWLLTSFMKLRPNVGY